MIKFKVLKYKHQRAAREMSAKIKAGEATNDEISLFVIDLVSEWDYTDAETGEPLPLSSPQAALDEMSLEQFNEMNKVFNEAMEVGASEVPKASDLPSPSGLTE